MLASRLEDPRRLADPRYSAEPELDGQRAQVHVHDHRTVHAFSHPGRGLIRLPGRAWLLELHWPVASAVLDQAIPPPDRGHVSEPLLNVHGLGCGQTPIEMSSSVVQIILRRMQLRNRRLQVSRARLAEVRCDAHPFHAAQILEPHCTEVRMQKSSFLGVSHLQAGGDVAEVEEAIPAAAELPVDDAQRCAVVHEVACEQIIVAKTERLR